MFKQINNNQFYKTITYNGLIVFFRVLSSFIVSKVSAMYLGPSGYALLGNLKNIIQGLLGFTITGFESGTIKYISENSSNRNRQNEVIINIIVFSFIISLIFSLITFFFSEDLALYSLKENQYAVFFKLLAFLLPIISFSWLILYITNGLQNIKLYSILLIIFNVLNALITFVLIYTFGLKGAILASFSAPAINFLISLFFKEIRLFFISAFKNLKKVSLKFFRSISVYILMALYSSLLISVCYLLIRNRIIFSIDTRNAGLWEAMNKISSFYMMFFSSIFTLYLLPRLSKNTSREGYHKIMKKYFMMLVPILIVFFLVIFLLRFFIIRLFLTNDFVEISQYFYLQLFGDIFKILGFSLAYQFHAKKMVKAYLVSDMILYGVFCVVSFFLIDKYGLQGTFYAYILSTSLYFITVVLLLFNVKNKYLINEK
ncbi:O-antigen translocase [Aestuariibaculum marinum]|uniref:O-antigen translocase n=1 Tax=Aestuariibaculum marinum TaxID=2683592 RepID=A0A8J6QB48_9FLAO|nr:O-antigen translocase [Aestuariibaculum marinum]MBD0824316.1 O-antigen translocase [Aestuariibaculum marinum]